MRRYRWLILILLFPVYVCLLIVISRIVIKLIFSGPGEASSFTGYLKGVFDWSMLPHDQVELGTFVLPAILVALTQVLFLAAVMRPSPIALTTGKSLKLSMFAAALVGSALTVGLYASICEIFGVWEDWMETQNGWFDSLLGSDVIGITFLVWLYIIVGWVIWTPLLIVFAKRRKGRRFHERIIGLLLAGTILELLVVVPIDIMVRRRDECYCASGTFTALCISVWALLWLTGPGIILAITSRRRKWWLKNHCYECGYMKGPSPGERCPECGFAWLEEDNLRRTRKIKRKEDTD